MEFELFPESSAFVPESALHFDGCREWIKHTPISGGSTDKSSHQEILDIGQFFCAALNRCLAFPEQMATDQKRGNGNSVLLSGTPPAITGDELLLAMIASTAASLSR